MVFRTMSPDEIRYWYTEELSEAFAPNERKPLQDILMLQNEGRYELWGLFDATQIAGYATIWKAPGIALVLLDYLGVSKRLRNGGLGSDILSRLRAQGRPIVTERSFLSQAAANLKTISGAGASPFTFVTDSHRFMRWLPAVCAGRLLFMTNMGIRWAT